MCTLGKALEMLDVSARAPKYGYRTWKLHWNGCTYKLGSLFHDYDWQPERQQSEWFPWDWGARMPYQINRDNNHGFYITRHFRNGKYEGIVGVAAVSGRVARHKIGYRGEWAQPRAILLPRRYRRREVEKYLRENYPQVKFFHHTLPMVIWKNWHSLIRR